MELSGKMAEKWKQAVHIVEAELETTQAKLEKLEQQQASTASAPAHEHEDPGSVTLVSELQAKNESLATQLADTKVKLREVVRRFKLQAEQLKAAKAAQP